MMKIHEYDSSNPLHKERFAALNREWLERYFRVEEFDAVVFADPEGLILADGGVILFAETEEGIVGTGALVPMEKGVYEIAKMGVTDQCQARGIGECLLTELIGRAHMLGASKLFIVSNTRLERAIRLYRRKGFADSTENRHSHYERGDITLELSLLTPGLEKCG